MTIRRQFLAMLVLFGVFLTLITSGCGGGVPGVKVAGSVTKDGKPLESVNVSFNALDKQKGASGGTVTDAEGKFELKLIPGKYTVTMSKLVDKKGNVPKASESVTEDFAQQEASGKLKQVIPDKFFNFDFSPFNNIDIPAEGKQLAPFDLK